MAVVRVRVRVRFGLRVRVKSACSGGAVSVVRGLGDKCVQRGKGGAVV